jgi:hypothetical protein
MLQYFLWVLLGPVNPPHQVTQQGGGTRPCNVVGGCGAGCLCVPDHEAVAPKSRGMAGNDAKPRPLPRQAPHVLDYHTWKG